MTAAFTGKTIAITGAAGGIGQWLCRFFGEEGATIAALDRSDKVHALAETLGKDGITVKPAVADIADAASVAAAFKGFGEVHILVNNAGITRHATFEKTDPAGWDEDMAANVPGGSITYFGLFTEAGRLAVLAGHNNDLANFWDWYGDGGMPLKPSTDAFRLGTSAVLFSITH